MRTIRNLSKMDGRVYLYLRSEFVMRHFLANAEAEGFLFCDGTRPTERPGSDIYAVNDNMTINFVGFIGHLAFKNPKNMVGKPMIRIDYEKYMSDKEDYII